MIARQRQDQILQRVEERGTVTVTELAALFETSESTIRRDLSELDSQGRLVKVHGGATSLEDEHVLRDLTIDERADMHTPEKDLIASFAATLVGPEDCVYLDAGTTTRRVVDALDEPRALYVTDSVANALALTSRGMRAVLVGGELKSATEALVGPEALATLRDYHFTIGFFGANGITAEQGMTTPDRNEAMVKRVALEHTARPYVLSDASKFGRTAAISYASIDSATIVTDRVPKAYRDLQNVTVVPQPQRD